MGGPALFGGSVCGRESCSLLDVKSIVADAYSQSHRVIDFKYLDNYATIYLKFSLDKKWLI